MIVETKKSDKRILLGYTMVQVILFFMIKWAESSQTFMIYGKIEYGAIVLNYLLMLYFNILYGGKYKIPLALTMTLCADYFLTLTGKHFLLGVFCFCIVQMLYGWEAGYQRWNLCLRVVLWLMFVIIMSILGMNLGFSLLCGCSIALLLGNCSVAFCRYQQSPSRRNAFFFWGLLFFAGCDISLGLGLITSGIAPLKLLHDTANQMVWIFYIPSQFFLTLVSVFDCDISMSII